MKKFLLGIIAGLLISSTVVFASNYLYHADEVSYDPQNTNWHVSNVDEAIEELYDKVNDSKVELIGQYSGNQNIDVSSYKKDNDTVDNFIVEFVSVPDTGVASPYEAGWNSKISKTTLNKQLSGNTLKITGMQFQHGLQITGPYVYSKTDKITYKVYHV